MFNIGSYKTFSRLIILIIHYTRILFSGYLIYTSFLYFIKVSGKMLVYDYIRIHNAYEYFSEQT